MLRRGVGERPGLNPTDVRCVNLLDEYGTMTAGALAGVAGLSTGAVTFLLDRLESAGFVRRLRDAQDRRRVLVELVRSPGLGLPSCTRVSRKHGGVRAAAFVVDLESIIDFLREGASSTNRKCRSCVRKSRRSVSGASSGRAAIKAAVKAQAKAEAMEKLEQTARKLQAKANELHKKAGRI